MTVWVRGSPSLLLRVAPWQAACFLPKQACGCIPPTPRCCVRSRQFTIPNPSTAPVPPTMCWTQDTSFQSVTGWHENGAASGGCIVPGEGNAEALGRAGFDGLAFPWPADCY